LAVVGFAELTQATRQAASTTKAFFTFYAAAGVLYLVLSIASTMMFARIERWARRGQRRTEG
jgi:polar amino acid transport system permease protein